MGISESAARKILKDKYPPPGGKRTSGKVRPVKHCHDGQMTMTEKEYAQKYLDPLIRSGELVRYEYERKTFVLADGCTYTPDFWCVFHNHIEVHEIKGGYDENKGNNSREGKTKWKIAAHENPEFVWKFCRKTKNGKWEITLYS